MSVTSYEPPTFAYGSASASLTDLQSLEQFVADNADLERLEARISAFNVFEAVGMTGQEIRHSFFLAFLLDPSQNHGLRDGFLKRFLSMTVRGNPAKRGPVSLVDIDVWDFDDAEVAREQDRIDIRIRVPSHRLIIIIENKIYSGEHSGQLARYLEAAKSRYPGWKILPVYLTLSGAEPSDLNYLQVSYKQIADLVDDTANRAESTMGREVYALLKHYVQMLRRHHLADTEIDDLCARIYQRHKRALDLIYEKRPDRQSELAKLIRQMIGETVGIDLLDSSAKNWFTFWPEEWRWDSFQGASYFKDVQAALYFSFLNESNRLYIRLHLCVVDENLRRRVLDCMAAAGAPFAPARGKNVPFVYRKEVMDAQQLEDRTMEEIEADLRQVWAAFVSEDFAKICAVIAAEFAPHETSLKD